MEVGLDTVLTYRRVFGADPIVLARAPGRINLIGEHTDYTGGLVLPFAIDRAVEVAAGPAQRGSNTVHSVAMGNTLVLDKLDTTIRADGSWQDYVRGTVDGLRRRGIGVAAVNLCIGGDLPPRQGMSSSAALCVSVALAVAALAEAELEPIELVEIAQAAERDFAGTPCGMMDPYASVFGRAGHAMLLDCGRLQHRYVPIDLPGCQLVAIPSGIERALTGGPYERRVAECEEAAATLRNAGYVLASLRDVTQDTLASAMAALTPPLARRVRHVVGENARVMQAVEALRNRRVEELGRLLNQSHDSLSQHFEVSSPEMDSLVTSLRSRAGVLGARMIGGGFGGTVLALVRDEAVAGVVKYIASEWPAGASRTGPMPVSPARGAWVRRI